MSKKATNNRKDNRCISALARIPWLAAMDASLARLGVSGFRICMPPGLALAFVVSDPSFDSPFSSFICLDFLADLYFIPFLPRHSLVTFSAYPSFSQPLQDILLLRIPRAFTHSLANSFHLCCTHRFIAPPQALHWVFSYHVGLGFIRSIRSGTHSVYWTVSGTTWCLCTALFLHSYL